MDQTDVIVVGLGAMGSAVTLRLASRGLNVTAFDQFEPPHAQGSTHGETRITRLAIGEGPEYVPLVLRSHELWRDIERQTGASLLQRTGGLVLGQPDHPFLAQTRAAALQYGIDHRNLTNSELRRSFPMFGVDSQTESYLEPEAGYVRPEAAVAAQLALARTAGAQLIPGQVVESWEARGAGVTVSTPDRKLRARELVLCAGPWITKLAPQLRSLFAVQPQCLHWFAIRQGYEALREMPIFVWGLDPERDEFAHGTGFYGFPAIDGPGGGVKLATEVYGTTIDPDEPWREQLGDQAGAFYERWIAQRFPWVGPEALRSIPCPYTSTRGSRFIIDRHPVHPNVTIVSACSGHGFKHSAAIGEAVAEMIDTGTTTTVLKPFALPENWSQPAG